MSLQTLVIGGKGKTGRSVVKKLKERNIDCLAGTRSPKIKGDIYFDWMDQERAVHAFKNVDRVYIIAPTNSTDHQAIVLPILESAKSLGVKRFVLLSASSLQMGGPMMGKIHEWVAKNTLEWSVLRPTWFMQNFSEQQHHPTIRDERKIYSATGEGKVGFIDTEDIAEVAVQALTVEKPWNSDFIITGPELLSYTDIAKSLTKTLSTGVVHQNLKESELISRYQTLGFNHDYSKLLTDMDVQISKGAENKLTDNVEKLTGKKPRAFKEFALLNKDSWK